MSDCIRAGVSSGTLLMVLAMGCGLASAGDTGFLDRTLRLDGVPHRYQVYVPQGYTPDRRWPVILCLHGSGERGTDGVLQTEIGFGTALRRHASLWPVIAVFPQAPPDTRWPGASSRIALLALERTQREFRTDPDRVYLTGLSMGGTARGTSPTVIRSASRRCSSRADG